ncbi:MAG: FtsX-like permease family protein, partial [Melioribacteraceae bacterium]
MSVCLLIIIFGRQLLSYDNFHKKSGRIFHVYSDYKADINPTSNLYATTPFNLGTALKDESPEVEDFVTLNRYSGKVIKDNNKYEVYGFYASGSFFNLFDFKLLKGNPQTALEKINSIVITDETAERIWGAKNVIGKLLIIEGAGEFLVTGIIEKPSSPSMIDFEVLLSYDVNNPGMLHEDQKTNWNNNIRDFYTFVLLKENVSLSNFTNNFTKIITKHYPEVNENKLTALNIQNIRDIATGPFLDNQIKFFIPAFVIYILGALSLVILFAAVFNYVGLSIARALKRSREVGVRKVIGAVRSQILTQFLIEAVIISLISLSLAVVILTWLVEGFNNLTPIIFTKSQVHPQISDISLYAAFIFFSLLVGVLSGLYPA